MIKNEIQKYLEKHGFEAFSPKAVLFDMDGVLYDSMKKHAIAWKESMKSFGIKITEEQVFATEGMKGVDTIRLLVKEQWGKDISEDEAQKMYDEKGRLFHQMPEAPIYDGVIDLMKKIKASGLTMGIVTGSAQQQLIDRVANDFKEFVDKNNIVTAYNIKHGKPAPDPYLKGLKLTGNYQPWEGIVVENAPMGVRAGVAANIFTVAINSGPLDDRALLNEGSNLLFHKITEFCDAWEEVMDNSFWA